MVHFRLLYTIQETTTLFERVLEEIGVVVWGSFMYIDIKCKE